MTAGSGLPGAAARYQQAVELQLVLAWALWCGVLSVLLVRVIDD